jgi:hypothetical protein
MRILESLDAGDRKILLWAIGSALVLAVLTGLMMPDPNTNDNPVPSSYLAGQHGARAAYETLLRSGYPIERWERPLSDLASVAGPETVVIFAEPFSREPSDINAVRTIVDHGGRVLATGFWGGFLVPGGEPALPNNFSFAACDLEPEGLDPLADSGDVWMVPEATWQVGNPMQRIQYSCAGQPAVVEYDYGKGHVVWWASASPLENRSLARADDLGLLLSSLGPRTGHRFYWDESLHGDVRSTWDYVAGPAFNLLRLGLIVVGLLVIFSFSRRGGPVREILQLQRGSPVEFVQALGSLYRNAGAQATAVSTALERFRRCSLRMCGLRPSPMRATELAAMLRRRFPALDSSLETDLVLCEDAIWSPDLESEHALRLVRTLHLHQKQIEKLTGMDAFAAAIRHNESNKKKRAS